MKMSENERETMENQRLVGTSYVSVGAPRLQDATELRSLAETRREAAVAELRREILQLQQDFAQRGTT